MNASILSIGDELVLGQTVDTNSAWMSRQLAAAGVAAAAHATVGDDQSAIEEAIRSAISSESPLLIVSGGLGPTLDDLTRQAIAAVIDEPLEINQQWLAHMTEYFRSRRREMPDSNRIQAMVPRTAALLWNNFGTACGILVHREIHGVMKRIVALPGVPREMQGMFLEHVLPIVRPLAGGAVILSRTLHTFGLGESAIGEKLGMLMQRGRNPSVGTTVAGGLVSLRINSRFGDLASAETALTETEAACRAALGDLVFGSGDESLAQIVASLLSAAQDVTVTTAESCTGGLLAKMLTDVPGSSRYFQRGFITYSNAAKTEMLGVPTALIEQHGAVSEPVAQAMATGARSRGSATYALAITGIAGPEGGTPTKPVGTVCFGLAYPGGVESRTFGLPGDRETIRDRSAKMALTLLRFKLLGRPIPF